MQNSNVSLRILPVNPNLQSVYAVGATRKLGEFVREADGMFVFYPNAGQYQGAWTERNLLDLQQALRGLNADWEAELAAFLDELSKLEPVEVDNVIPNVEPV
jgi:hypothetical protein